MKKIVLMVFLGSLVIQVSYVEQSNAIGKKFWWGLAMVAAGGYMTYDGFRMV